MSAGKLSLDRSEGTSLNGCSESPDVGAFALRSRNVCAGPALHGRVRGETALVEQPSACGAFIPREPRAWGTTKELELRRRDFMRKFPLRAAALSLAALTTSS